MAAKLTPREFADLYFNLDLYLYEQELKPADAARPGGYAPPTDWQKVRVDNYRLGASQWDGTFWSHDIALPGRNTVEVCVQTVEGFAEEVTLPIHTARKHFHQSFVGKGSPEQAGFAIQLLYRYRKVTTPLKQFVAGNFIGLDCNGFIGNYIQRIVQGKLWQNADNDADPGPTTFIDGLLNMPGMTTPVKTADDLKPDGTYLFGMCEPNGKIIDPKSKKDLKEGEQQTYGHIMMTEPGTLMKVGENYTIGVVEATAAGDAKLRSLDYVIRPQVTKGAYGPFFTIERGSPNALMTVRISRLAV